MTEKALCKISDINENSSKGFSFSEKEDEQEIFIVKRDGEFYAYKNLCPHTGASLNWQADVFLDYDEFYIQCAIHGARFEVETGLCVWGPCVNRSLMTVDIEVRNDMIYLK